MPLLEEAARGVYPVYVDRAVRVTVVGTAAQAAADVLPAGLLDRLRAAFVATDASALAAPALRVTFAATAAAAGTGTGRVPGTFDGRLRALFAATDAAKADGAPALRVIFA